MSHLVQVLRGNGPGRDSSICLSPTLPQGLAFLSDLPASLFLEGGRVE